jgi:transcriptional regulator with GAF, ATPase, and Fis domain
MRQASPESRLALERKIHELSGLLEVARALVAAADVPAALRHFLLSSIGVLASNSGAVFRYREPTGRLVLVAERGSPEGAESRTVLSAREVAFLEGSQAREGVALRPRPTSAEARAFVRDQGRWLGSHDAEAIVPLVGRGGLWGVALFGRRLLGEPYGEAERSILATAAQIAASALENLEFHSAHRGDASLLDEEPAARAAGTDDRRGEDLAVLRVRHPVLREIVGDSESLAKAIRELVQVAPTRWPVLILGETGTGKEMASRSVHRMSPRCQGPFEVVDCGAIPRELIESELFGHVRGAFTGATRDRRGAFELAHGGTLFLDEIGELPGGAQTRLLRVLQEGQLRRVGDERAIHVDVRVVAATNRDLLQDVKAGRFRPDLYYRIGVFTVQLPPLRERPGDLPILAKSILERIASETGRPVPPLARAVLRRLTEYPFHGNVRELQNILTVLLLRAPAEGASLEDLEEVLAQSGGEVAGGAARPSDDEEAPVGRRDAEATGRWVLDQIRRTDFNLSHAERTLARLRRSPAGQAAAPVADRASLTYYLQGECFRAFAESGFDLHAAARSVASIADLEPRARQRLESYLSFLAEVAASCGSASEAKSACRERLPKLPVLYQPYLDAVVEGLVRGAWSPSSKD